MSATATAAVAAVPDNDDWKWEQTLMEVRKNQAKWPEVPTMSGDELFEILLQEQQQQQQPTEDTANNKVVLIDVRSPAERNVSMIAHAITLSEYYQTYKHKNKNNNAADSTAAGGSPPSSSSPKVIVYCTIGYRSGMEATHLLHQDESLRGRIYNMAGIVAFSHALAHHYAHTNPKNRTRTTTAVDDGAEEPHPGTNTNTNPSPLSSTASSSGNNYQRTPTMEAMMRNDDNENDNADTLTVPFLIDPATQLPTRVVHTFGAPWDLCPTSVVEETRQFSTPALVCHLLQLMGLMFLRFIQRWIHSLLDRYYNGRHGQPATSSSSAGMEEAQHLDETTVNHPMDITAATTTHAQANKTRWHSYTSSSSRKVIVTASGSELRARSNSNLSTSAEKTT